MNSLIPFIAAIMQSASYTLDKTILSVKKVPFKAYLGVSFPFLFIADLIIFTLFGLKITPELFIGNLGWLLGASIVLTIGSNVIFYFALEGDTLGEIETFALLAPIPTVIFSGLVFADERNAYIIALALVASFAVALSHIENYRLHIKRKTLIMLCWFLLVIPLSAGISKTLLQTWSPITLELVKDGVAAAILGGIFFKEARKTNKEAFPLLLATNGIGAIAWMLYFTSFQKFGIVYTALLFSIQPLLTYFSSVVFLKEKLQWKKVTAFAVVLAAAVIAQIIRPI